MRDKTKDIVRIKHILEAIKDIENYTENIDKTSFITNKMMIDACIRQMGIIGEASNHLSEEIIESAAEIPWREIIGLRNVVVHEYFGVDIIIIWDIIDSELVPLKNTLQKILTELE